MSSVSSVTEDTYASNEDLLAKLQAGATGYDLIVPSDYMINVMHQLDLIAELDFDNIPNFANVDEKFLDPPYDPGNVYSVPYQWAPPASDTTPSSSRSRPAVSLTSSTREKLAETGSRVSMLNDSRESIGAALRYLGYSVNSQDEQELEEAKEVLIKQKEWVTAYDSDGFEDPAGSGRDRPRPRLERGLLHGGRGSGKRLVQRSPRKAA